MLFLFNIVATTIDAGPPTVRQFGQSGTVELGRLGSRKSANADFQRFSQRFAVRISSSSEANRLLENIAIIPDKLISTPVLFFIRSPEWARLSEWAEKLARRW